MLNLLYNGMSEPYIVNFRKISDHVVEVTGPRLIKSTKGFKLSRINHDDDWDYSWFNTVYRVVEGGYQFSDDGSIWIDPTPPVPTTKDVIFSILWDETQSPSVKRPSEVKLSIFLNGEFYKDGVFTEETGWTATLHNVPYEDVYTVEAPEIPNYECTVSDTTVLYTVPAPYKPSVEDQLEELNMIICDLDNRVYELENPTVEEEE